MSKVSIIIPSRAEKPENLQRTIDSIYENATGDFEIIVGFNGAPFTLPKNIDNRYLGVFFPRNIGIKGNINALVAMAEGKYIYKSDAHCSFGKGFDEILQEDMQDDWIVMPRFYVLNGDTWEWQDERFYDYFFMHCPLTDKRGYRFKAAGHDPEKTKERLLSHPNMDESPSIHGSGWFMEKDHFFRLGGFPITDPNGHAQEPQWLALRNWLKGGKVMVNKKTWYAHLHQGNQDKGYHYTRQEEEYTYNWTAEHFMFNKEPNLIHDMTWFVDTKFPNMPTWPNNWKQLQEEYEKNKINT